MNVSEKFNKLKALNEIIRNAVVTESTSEMVSLIVLSARVATYLRNNDMEKYGNIECEIEEAIFKYKKYLNLLKKSA